MLTIDKSICWLDNSRGLDECSVADVNISNRIALIWYKTSNKTLENNKWFSLQRPPYDDDTFFEVRVSEQNDDHNHTDNNTTQNPVKLVLARKLHL